MSAGSVESSLPEGVHAASAGMWLDRRCRRLVLRRLQDLKSGRLQFVDPCGVVECGSAGAALRVRVQNVAAYRRILFGGSVGAAEAFIDGHWEADDLTAVLRLLARNRAVLESLNSGKSALRRMAGRIGHRLRANTRANAARNIAAHYDLGNEFFRLFLDARLMYSSAVFERPEMSLDEAAVAKLDRICRRIRLTATDHVLEIGTGWGGFACYAAAAYGCRVTTTTISQAQYEHAQAEVHRAGLADRVTVLRQDYRDLNGQYDKLVSIEMIEAVGLENLETYFRACARLLKPDGCLLLQTITVADSLYAKYRRGADFIQRYIFPGGALPSVGALQQAATASGELRLLLLEDIASHYARTLREWRAKFHSQLDQVRAQGFSERFIRMWDYYLCYCEAGFEEHTTGTSQLLFAMPGCRIDPGSADAARPATGRRESAAGSPAWKGALACSRI